MPLLSQWALPLRLWYMCKGCASGQMYNWTNHWIMDMYVWLGADTYVIQPCLKLAGVDAWQFWWLSAGPELRDLLLVKLVTAGTAPQPYGPGLELPCLNQERAKRDIVHVCTRLHTHTLQAPKLCPADSSAVPSFRLLCCPSSSGVWHTAFRFAQGNPC